MSSFSKLNFNANDHEPESFDLLPPGEYEIAIVGSVMKDTRSGGEMLVLTHQVLNGEFQNRKLWDNLNLVNKNPQAVEIANKKLSSICRAVDVMAPKDPSELHDKPLVAKVAIEEGDGKYDDKNVVKGYKARETIEMRTAPDEVVPVSDGEMDWE